MSTIHLPAGHGQHYRMIDGDHIAKAAIRDTEGAFEVFEVLAPSAPMAPPHISPWTGVLFLLEGRVTALVDGTTYEVHPGEVVMFPAGTPSSFQVLGESARFLAITSGDRAGRFFDDFANSVPLDQPLEESIATILSVAQRHGVTLAHT